eukprot:scaffold22874_cov29-Attheya_sp.AAC.1
MKLVKLLQRLNKEHVTIELKNGTVIQGIVVGVDATMNCHLRNTKVTLSLRGSTMWAWLLLDSLNLDALLVETDARENANQKAAAAGVTPASASGMASG